MKTFPISAEDLSHARRKRIVELEAEVVRLQDICSENATARDQANGVKGRCGYPLNWRFGAVMRELEAENIRLCSALRLYIANTAQHAGCGETFEFAKSAIASRRSITP